jgi:hypothetical protein
MYIHHLTVQIAIKALYGFHHKLSSHSGNLASVQHCEEMCEMHTLRVKFLLCSLSEEY